MKKLLLFVLLACSGIFLQAQPNLDSLFTVWQDANLTDSTRVTAYNDFIEVGYLYSRPDTTVVLADLLHTYAVDNGYPRAAAQGFRLQGVANAIMGNYALAGDFFKKSLEIFKKIGDKPAVARNLRNMGNVSLYQGNGPLALDYNLKALSISEEIGDEEGIGLTLDNLGNLYYSLEEYEAALKYANRSLKLLNDFGNEKDIVGRLSNIGSIYWAQEKYALALEYNQQALDIYQKLGDKNGISVIMSNNGAIHLKLGNPIVAMEFVEKALALSEELGMKDRTARDLINYGTLLLTQNKYANASDYCKRGLILAEEIGALSLEENAYSCLYDANKAMKKNAQALLYLERKQAIQDSLNTQETSKKLQQMEFAKQVLADSLAAAEATRLAEEVHQEEVRQKNQTRNILVGIAILVLLLAAGLYSRVRFIRKSKAVLQVEKDRSENLLLNILPADIAAELKEKGRADARDFDLVSILFTDFKGFTSASEKLSAQELVAEINACFEAFDSIMEKYNIEKIKTIGDAYMAAGGLPVPVDDSVKNTVLAALEMQAFIHNRKAENDMNGRPAFEMRVGIHTGPVVAGIVGIKKFQYDIWGDTVNTASRMESSGEVGRVNLSQTTYELLKDDPNFSFESRGKIEAKGKGEVEMWFVSHHG